MDLEIAILGLCFVAMVTFVMVGEAMFAKGWDSYEEHYVKGAEKTLDAMYMTMPAQNVLYIGLAFFLFMLIFATYLTGQLAVGLILGVASFFVPQGVIRVMKKRRDIKFGLQLIDALGTMGNALKAGLSLPQSFELIHQQMDNPIRQEFRLLNYEMRFGMTLNDAMAHLLRRMPNPDIALMSTAISVAQEVGGNLSEIFDNIATTIRERNHIEQRVKALTSQGKMQGIILCMVPIGLGTFLSVVYPDMMEPLFTTGLGWSLIIAGAVLLGLGGFFISKIIDIDI